MLSAEREIVASRPEKLVVRVDRTDPSKNIVRGFRAFELYLDAHPEMHRRVGMLALLDPSRQDIPEYAEYLGAIQREARRVNDRFQQSGWRPIDLEIADDFPQSVAAYKQFDVLLVNAIFDGMNLVAKEAPLVNERDGVVVLSENAGAHAELGEWALTVNPFDVEGQAEAIGACPVDGRGRAARAARGHSRARARARFEPVDGHAARRPRSRGSAGAPLGSNTGMGELSHVTEAGDVRMVDVGGKPLSRRRAVARASRADGSGDRDGDCASCRRATRWRPRRWPGSWPRSERAS